MGYYTDYSLLISCASFKNGVFKELRLIEAGEGRCAELQQEIKKMGVFECVNINPIYEYGDAWRYNVKWYDHDDDMLALSCRFPEFFFSLHGEGDERDDLWNKYYFNGEMQECRAEIVWPQFDYTKLVTAADARLRSPNYRYSYE